MIKRILAATLWLLALCFGALAEQAPDASCFSPGLARLAEGLENGTPLIAEFGVQADHFFYIRDMSLLRRFLNGMTFSYTGGGSLSEGSDALTVRREGETVFSASLERNGKISRATIGEKAFFADTRELLDAIGASEAELPWQKAAVRLLGPAVFNRIELSDIEDWLRESAEGTMLPGGVRIVRGFEWKETWSDDGLRFTRLDLSGEAEIRDGQRFLIEGYFRTPGGKNPKDTAVLTFTAGENSALTLEMSSQHRSSSDKKKTQGSASVDTTVKVSGKLNGYAVSTRLTIHQQNAWSRTDDVLKEKLTISVSLGHTDKTPGRRKLRLNDLAGKLRLNLTITSDTENTTLHGSIGAELDMDSNDTLDASVTLDAVQGGELPPLQTTGTEEPSALREIVTALSDETFAAAKRLYAQLPQDVREKLADGLQTESTIMEE